MNNDIYTKDNDNTYNNVSKDILGEISGTFASTETNTEMLDILPSTEVLDILPAKEEDVAENK